MSERQKLLIKLAESHLLRLVYLLNQLFFPPPKWLTTGLCGVKEDFDAGIITKTWSISQDFTELYRQFRSAVRQIGEHLIKHNILERECVTNYGKNFAKDWRIFDTF